MFEGAASITSPVGRGDDTQPKSRDEDPEDGFNEGGGGGGGEEEEGGGDEGGDEGGGDEGGDDGGGDEGGGEEEFREVFPGQGQQGAEAAASASSDSPADAYRAQSAERGAQLSKKTVRRLQAQKSIRMLFSAYVHGGKFVTAPNRIKEDLAGTITAKKIVSTLKAFLTAATRRARRRSPNGELSRRQSSARRASL